MKFIGWFSLAIQRWPPSAIPAILHPLEFPPRRRFFQAISMHYPRKTSKIKRIRKVGFRSRMSTTKGRKIMNSKRRVGRTTTLTK